MTARYSAFGLLRDAFGATVGDDAEKVPVWRDATPGTTYDVIIVGAGGHGLATAYYLARNHGVRNIAVLEKSWLGGGNAGRNTAIVRSSYLLEQNSKFYEFSMKLWENLSVELNYNVMFSQRGMVNLAHSYSELGSLRRRGNAMRVNGIDAEVLNPEALGKLVPGLDLSGAGRAPIVGGLIQKRGGIARHDAVAWGYARAASRYGVDIIQQCEVTALQRDASGRITGVDTTRGAMKAAKVLLCVSGDSGRLAGMAGLRLPLESHVLQALVSEPVKPVLNVALVSGALHVYINQSDKGEIVMGGDIDGYNTYARRGTPEVLDRVIRSAVTLLPFMSQLRLMRSWGGTVDMTMDGSPIMDRTPVAGLFLGGGWCYGGFKATPAAGWCLAHLVATGNMHPVAQAFSFERFQTGQLLDERGSGCFPWMH